jgi:hypothetical protein
VAEAETAEEVALGRLRRSALQRTTGGTIHAFTTTIESVFVAAAEALWYGDDEHVSEELRE